MKNKFSYIIIIIIGIFNIFYGINYELKEYKFLKNSIKTKANIYQSVDNGNMQTLYIKYSVDGKNYDSVFTVKEKITKSTITIYCDKSNPLKFTDGIIKKGGYLSIFIGVIFEILVIGLIFRKKEVDYNGI